MEPSTPAAAILSSVAKPSSEIVPTTVYFGCSSESSKTRKNWLPLVSTPALASATVPRGYTTGLFSAGSFGANWFVGYSLLYR